MTRRLLAVAGLSLLLPGSRSERVHTGIFDEESDTNLESEGANQSLAEIHRVGLDAGTEDDLGMHAKSLGVLSWNVENLLYKDWPNGGEQSEHIAFVTALIASIVDEHKVQVVMLQEVQGCALFDNLLGKNDKLEGWNCVDSNINAKQEEKISHIALGNVILYDAIKFQETHANRAIYEKNEAGVKKMMSFVDKDKKTLKDHHAEECLEWAALNKQNSNLKNGEKPQCTTPYDDTVTPNSVRLQPIAAMWTKDAYAAIANGVRFFNLHLFAGVGRGLPDSACAGRRKFQFRGTLALTSFWNSLDATSHGGKGHGTHEVPTTVFAGDFNTGKGELQGLAASESSYGMQLQCPLEGGTCLKTSKSVKTAKGGAYDHFMVDLQSKGQKISAMVIGQPKAKREVQSDHNPILLRIAPTVVTKVAKAPVKRSDVDFEAIFKAANEAQNQQVKAAAPLN